MNKRNEFANFDVERVFIDVTLIAFSYFLSTHIYHFTKGLFLSVEHLSFLLVYCIIYILSMFWHRMYNITTFFYIDRIIRRVFASCLLASGSVSSMVFIADQIDVSRYFFLIFSAVNFAFLLSIQLLYKVLKTYKVGNGYTHVLFVGTEKAYNRYIEFAQKTSKKVKVDFFVDFKDERLQTEETFENMILSNRVDEVVFVQDNSIQPTYDVEALLRVCSSVGLVSSVLLSSIKIENTYHYVSSLGPIPMITYHNKSLDSFQIFAKSAMDIVGSLLGLIIFSPILLITAVAIRIESKGPILFRQTRVGMNGKRFTIYKFRSMYEDAEERKKELMAQNKMADDKMFKIDNDPRITKVGRFIRRTSIDELPQLINVIKRDMSLVGTRPPTVDEVANYKRHHHRRISITPGITGMWQTSGRSDILDFEDVVELDTKYIDNWSIWLDIKLIFKTVFVVFDRRGAV